MDFYEKTIYTYTRREALSRASNSVYSIVILQGVVKRLRIDSRPLRDDLSV